MKHLLTSSLLVTAVGFVSACSVDNTVHVDDREIMLSTHVSAEAVFNEKWLNHLSGVFNVDGDVVRKTYDSPTNIVYTSLDKGNLTVGGNVNTGKPHVSLNYVETTGFPVWFYSNPQYRSLCCSCGACSGTADSLTIVENVHSYDEHGNVKVDENVLFEQVETILTELLNIPDNIDVSFKHSLFTDPVNKVTTVLVVDGVETGLEKHFYFNTEGVIYTATGSAVVLQKI